MLESFRFFQVVVRKSSEVIMLPTRANFVICGPLVQLLKNVSKRSGQSLFCQEISALLLGQTYQPKYSTNMKQKSNNTSQNSSTSITEKTETEQSQLTLGAKVKQTTKDASYLGVIIAGIGVTGVMFYAILRELFSGQSPNSVYTEALKLCKNNQKVSDAVGEPIKGYGETTARGRRRYVSHMEYVKDDINYMRMKFYIEGSRRKGTVHLEVKENSKGKYDYRYLFVTLEGYPANTIVLVDNRHLDSAVEG